MSSAWPRKRARDLDRIDVGAALDSAYADGQLDGEEHRTRTAAAMSAKTLTELRELVQDLQVRQQPANPPQPVAPTSESSVPTLTGPLPPKARPFARFAARIRDILILVGALTVVLWVGTYDWSDDPPPSGPGISAEVPAAGPEVTPLVVPPVALHTPEGFRRFVDAVRAEYGSTEVAQATVYPDYASVGVPVPGTPGRVQVHVYEGGFGKSSAALTRDADSRAVDLAAFDVDAVLGLVASAGQRLNVENPNQLRVMFRDIGDGPRAMVEAFGDSGQYGWLEATPDGTITEQHAFVPA